MTPAEAIRRAAAFYREIAAASTDTVAHETVAEWLESYARDCADGYRRPDGSWSFAHCDSPPAIDWALKIASAFGFEVTA